MIARRSLLAVPLLPLFWFGCSVPRSGSEPPAAGTVLAPAPASWVDAMADVVGPGFDDVLSEETSKDPAAMDFAKVERTARQLAATMALGHGALEDEEVPDFAQLARNCEQWLLEIAGTARARRGAELRRLVLEGSLVHCEACHEAFDSVH